MANFFRFLLALAGLPFAWAVTRVGGDVLVLLVANEGLFSRAGVPALFGGFLLAFVLLLVLPSPTRLYVFGHELTHAVWGLAFGARVSNLKVGLRGGSVMLTKSNVWITLAPYFFPFYTVVVILVALVTRLFVTPLPCPAAWLAAIGATWCFHVFFTLRALCQRQPDVEEYGHLFSYAFIWIFTVLGVVAGVVCTTEITWAEVGRFVASRTAEAYSAVSAGCFWMIERVRRMR